MAATDPTAHAAQELRPLLFSIAYRMIGSVAEAEDVVQEALLRYHRARQEGASEIASPRAYLSAIATRLAIDHLRSARVRREQYVGPWLPEPLVADPAQEPSERAELADSLSLAFLLVLERLNPLERAVFLLHDVFDFPYGEIAAIVDRSEQGCRQLATRARRHVDEERPRFPLSRARQEELTARFLAACAEGDTQTLVALLAEDADAWSDGGGKANAARRVVVGAEPVARFLVAIARAGLRRGRDVEVRPALVGGQAGVLLLDRSAGPGGAVSTALALDFGVGERVRRICMVLNPDKLVRAEALVRRSASGGGGYRDPMTSSHSGADRVGHGESSLGDAQSSNPPDDPTYLNEDALPLDADTDYEGEGDPPPVERGNEDPAPNSP